MTANGDADPRPPPRVVKIRPTAYMFGNYEVRVLEPGEVTTEALNLMLKLKGDKSDINLCLSFKHIVRVDFMDNTDREGAGMIVYVNEYMAKKVETVLRFEPQNFRNFHNDYAKHAFILMDIINSDPKTMADLRQVLQGAAEYHKNYVNGRSKHPPVDAPARYLTLIDSDYFKRILSTLHKELYIEEVVIKGGLKYPTGRIVNTEPNTKCTVQQDGRIVPVTPADTHMSGRPRPIVDRSRTYAMNRLPLDGGPQPKLARISRLPVPRQPISGEVHTIEDDAAQGPIVPHKLIATYQPNGKVKCEIFDQDLFTLNATEMLNDTIIEFYMNYILNDLLDTSKRDEVHVFSTYFFSKLSKQVYDMRNDGARKRKIRENYATLKSWTKSVNIFEKNFLVVPINEDAHWYLAIVAYPNLGIAMKSDEKKRANKSLELPATVDSNPAIPIFIFDSLMDPLDTKKHRAVADLLLDYLALEYADKKEEHNLPGIEFRQTPGRVIIPKSMPQQENYYDCGIFMLQFAESFLNRLPVLDEIVDPFAYDSFFGNVDLSGKREHIQNLIKGLSSPAQND